ncbi:hypothetical protein KJQ85_08890, partial [Campylobacter lari]|nr:hypothetical protein [Campylobacter lari]
DNDVFNTKATNNTPDPLKHRNFLKALDIIGQNNIKALYAGVNKKRLENQERVKHEKFNQSNIKQTIIAEKPPKMIGRLATTIIMKNGLCIG